MGKIVDLSVDDFYHSQVNNRYLPFDACMPTSFIMGLKDEGIPVTSLDSVAIISAPAFIHPVDMQPEDFLMVLMRSLWGISLRDKFKWAKEANANPNEVHEAVSLAVNAIVGKNVTEYLKEQTLENIESQILAKHPVVLGGGFTTYGHVVAVVGGVWDDSDKLSHLIVDDPYGDYFTGYKSKKGNGVRFPVDKFEKLWRHRFHRFDKNGV